MIKKNNIIKNTVLACTIAAGMLTIGGTTSEAALGDRALYQGVRSSDVKELQQVLKEKNYFNHSSTTTYFGNITKQAVKRFQKANGLAVDGSFGPASYRALTGKSTASKTHKSSASVPKTVSSLSYKRALRRGSKGSDVGALQVALKKLGHYKSSVDNSFGPGTRSAVLNFQKSRNLSVDGSVGPATVKTINAALGGAKAPVTTNSKPNRGTVNRKGRTITMNATAYTDDYASQGKWVGQTATGMKPQVGVVAVDPRVIPLGTKLYIEGYGNAIAGDTGGAIKGNRIDLFFNTKAEVRRFGRRSIKVTILK